MYENFYGLKEKPFSILPDPEYLYWSRSHELAYTILEYGILNCVGFTVITGEVGCGKTTLLRHLLNQLDDEITVGLLTNPPPENSDLLEWILMAFGLPIEGKSPATLYDDFRAFTIQRYEAGCRTLLIVDEAQNLGPGVLEQLRMLSNINVDKDQLLQLILVGQPQLKELLRKPELAQFAQRVGADFHLYPLNLGEAIGYIEHRLAIAGRRNRRCFTFDAVRRIHEESKGIPRLINILCDTSMVYGFARNVPVITARIVEEMIKDKVDHGVFDFDHTAPGILADVRVRAIGGAADSLRPAKAAPSGSRGSRVRASFHDALSSLKFH
jgi:type II secretory pathway predicted ATPase ExeA